MIRILKDHDQIELIRHNHYFIKVRFKSTNDVEYWALNDDAFKKRRMHVYRLPDKGPYFGGDLSLELQFETNPLYPSDYELLQNYFIIKREKIDAAKWCTLRLKAHNLAMALVKQGYVDVQYPDHILENDLNNLKSEDLNKFKKSPIRYSISTQHKIFGKRLIMHFSEPDNKVVISWQNPDKLTKTISKIFNSKQKHLTRENIVRYMHDNFWIMPPNFYRAIFKDFLNVNNKRVFDLNPDYSKAIAVMIDGGIYCSNTDYSKIAEFINGESSCKTDNIDIVMSCKKTLSIDKIDEIINTYGNKIYVVLTSKAGFKVIPQKYKHVKLIRVLIKFIAGASEDDYIFIIDQR